MLDTGCLLDYHYFKENDKLTAIYLNKQQAMDADPTNTTIQQIIQQINFTGNRNQPGQTTRFFIIGEEKEAVLEFSNGTVNVL